MARFMGWFGDRARKNMSPTDSQGVVKLTVYERMKSKDWPLSFYPFLSFCCFFLSLSLSLSFFLQLTLCFHLKSLQVMSNVGKSEEE